MSSAQDPVNEIVDLHMRTEGILEERLLEFIKASRNSEQVNVSIAFNPNNGVPREFKEKPIEYIEKNSPETIKYLRGNIVRFTPIYRTGLIVASPTVQQLKELEKTCSREIKLISRTNYSIDQYLGIE